MRLRTVGLRVGNDLGVSSDLLLLFLLIHEHEYADSDKEQEEKYCNDDSNDGANGEPLDCLARGRGATTARWDSNGGGSDGR